MPIEKDRPVLDVWVVATTVFGAVRDPSQGDNMCVEIGGCTAPLVAGNQPRHPVAIIQYPKIHNQNQMGKCSFCCCCCCCWRKDAH